MGDMGDLYNDLKSAKKSENNKEVAIKTAKFYLFERNIPFVCLNNEYHFVIDSVVDFYPTTGKFRNRITGQHGRGLVRALSTL